MTLGCRFSPVALTSFLSYMGWEEWERVYILLLSHIFPNNSPRSPPPPLWGYPMILLSNHQSTFHFQAPIPFSINFLEARGNKWDAGRN